MRVNLDYSEYRKKKVPKQNKREKAEKKNNFFMLAFQSLKLKGVVVIMLFSLHQEAPCQTQKRLPFIIPLRAFQPNNAEGPK